MLLVISKSESVESKAFFLGEIQVGSFIEPKNLNMLKEADSESELEAYIANSKKSYGRNAQLISLNTNIVSIWSESK